MDLRFFFAVDLFVGVVPMWGSANVLCIDVSVCWLVGYMYLACNKRRL